MTVVGGIDRALPRIAARAMFLRERISNGDPPLKFPDPERVDARVARWRAAVDHDGSDWLTKRLAWDGLDVETIAPLLDDPLVNETDALPTWASVLRDICSTAVGFDAAALAHAPVDAERPLPFEDLLLPAIAVARRSLFRQLGTVGDTTPFPLLDVLDRDAYWTLERGLLARLGAVAGFTLESEFVDVLPYGQSVLDRLLRDDNGARAEAGPASDDQYRQFVCTTLGDGMLGLFERLPVLGRFIASVVHFWVEATAELLVRLVADRRDLSTVFALGSEPLLVTSAEVAIADAHRQGRSVVVLDVASGHRLLYKPKPLALEVAFNALLAWCNQRSGLLELWVTNVLDRGDYGWAEFVDQQPCVDDEDARSFYTRAGMLLCLLHVVRATDCHHENLVAHGSQPVLVDAETLVAHDAELLEGAGADEEEVVAERELSRSVLRTGLLPRWQVNPETGVAYDVSGLGSSTDQRRSSEVLRWFDVNTDAMHAAYQIVPAEAEKNVAWLDGRALSPVDHPAELVAGFRQMYRFLMHHREELAADGPLAALDVPSVRYIHRPTRVYGAVMTTSLTPDVLGSGIEYGIHLEQLARAYLLSPERPVSWPLFDAEIRAMEQLDVPLFTAAAHGDAIDVGDGRLVAGALRRSGREDMSRHLGAMSESDLARQVAIIEGSLHARAAHTVSGEDADRRFGPSGAHLDRDAFIDEAVAIGTEIETRAIADGFGGVDWIGLGYIDVADRFQLQVLDDNLYDGAPGVAVFLAALGAVTERARFADLALRALQRSRRVLHAADDATRELVPRLRGIGGAVGVGSTVYAYTRIATMLGDDALLDDADMLALWITPAVIAGDPRPDVMNGIAGALLALTALYEVRPSDGLLERMVACGDRLLEQRCEAQHGTHAWPSWTGTPLTGLSHGAAGIAYALTRLAAHTSGDAYVDAAIDAMEFERSVYSSARSNWPDLRPRASEAPPSFPVKWCHGAAGIALARLASVESFGTLPGADNDIDAALHATRAHYLQDTDYVCCGNFGRVDAFLVAARATGERAWRDLAVDGAAAAVARAHRNGYYRLFVDVPGMYNPGFFQGMAGIGYELLRIADEQLPSVLVWD